MKVDISPNLPPSNAGTSEAPFGWGVEGGGISACRRSSRMIMGQLLIMERRMECPLRPWVLVSRVCRSPTPIAVDECVGGAGYRRGIKALTYHGKEDVRVDQVPDPSIQHPTDAIVRITSTAICGSDLHLYKVLGMFMDEGDILGHEPTGVV